MHVVQQQVDVAPGRRWESSSYTAPTRPRYLDPPRAHDGFDADGWFRSGDLGFVDAEWCITVTGAPRTSSTAGAEKLSPRRSKRSCAAIPRSPRPRWSPRRARVWARSRPRSSSGDPARTGPSDTLREFLQAEGVAPQKIPRIVVTVDELPRTASGKVKKYELVERLP